MISDKVRPHHLQRKAILYVRQSSAHQVLHNRESSALQYAMRDRLMALGWSEVEVIDDDLGRSAAGGVQRAGFERMVAEVCLGKVGAVCAREVSRFARNSRDWQQLIEMCRVVDTVLVDQETIYAPRHGNDRLLLGLKGSLNENELDLLRQRSLSARYGLIAGSNDSRRAAKWLQNRNFSGRQQAKEQSSCSEWTGIPPQTEHCCGDWKLPRRAFGLSPAGSFAWVGLTWCGGWCRANL
jgi:hypothetical protein